MSSGNWRSTDGQFWALLSFPSDNECDIFQFEAYDPKRGDRRRALKELRGQYRVIRAIGVGHESSESYGFWLRMASAGLVDVLLGDDQRVIWPHP